MGNAPGRFTRSVEKHDLVVQILLIYLQLKFEPSLFRLGAPLPVESLQCNALPSVSVVAN